MTLEDRLRDLAATWQSSGESNRLKGGTVKESIATTLIGCSQALLSVLGETDDAG